MDKKKDWTEYLKDIPGWARTIILLTPPIVTFIYTVIEHPKLIFSIIIIIALLYACGICFYFAFSKKVSPYRKPALGGVILFPLILLFWFYTTEPFHSSCFPPARPGESLVIVTKLVNNQSADYDAQSRIATGIDSAINQAEPDLNIRLELCDQNIRTSEEAKNMLKQMKATLVIWGFYDSYETTLFYTTSPNIASLDSSELEPEPVPTYTPEAKVNIPELGTNSAAWGFFTIAQTLQASAQYEEAIKAYESVISNDPGETMPGRSDLLLATYVQMGVIYDDFLGEPDKAQSKYKTAIEFVPDKSSAISYRYRGVAFRQLDEFDEARADATMAIELDARYPDPLLDLAIMDYRDGSYESALENLNRAIALEPNFAIAHYYEGLVYYASRDYEPARAEFSKAIDSDPKLYVAYYQRAAIGYFIEETQTSQVLNDLSISIDGLPNFGEPRLLRAIVYMNTDNKSANLAIDELNNIMQEFPAPKFPSLHDEALLYRGYAYYILNDDTHDKLALADLNLLIEENPDRHHVYYFRGLVYEREEKYALAIEDFNKEIEQDPENAAAFYHRGINNLGLRDGYLKLALEDLLEAMRLYKVSEPNKEPVQLYLVLTKLYLAQNRSCEARSSYQEYLIRGGNPVEGYGNIACPS